MTRQHKLLIGLSVAVLLFELFLLAWFHSAIINWLSHNLWVVAVPFAKKIFQLFFGFKILAFIKSISVLGWHLSKLLLLKVLKTLGLRYGVFFSQYRWYWIRRSKVMFLRRGKQFFRSVRKFWTVYTREYKVLILVAFFPVGIILFLLGLSFNITRKTMVQKTQETAIFKVATTAGNKNRGVKSWISNLDQITLRKIQVLTRRANVAREQKAADKSVTNNNQFVSSDKD